MGQVEDAVAGSAFWRVKERADIQGLTLQPAFECRGGQEVVQQHRQTKAVVLRVELGDREHAELLKRRILGLEDQTFQVQVFASAPGILKDIRKQDVFAGANWVDVLETDQLQQRGDRAGDAFTQHFLVLIPADIRAFERGQDADGNG